MQLIAKDRSTARLQDHNRQSRVNLRLKSAHDLPQILFGFLEHAEVIKRSPAAQRTSGTHHAESRRLQHFQGGPARFRMKLIVEGGRPHNELPTLRLRNRMPSALLTENGIPIPLHPLPKGDWR